MYVYIYTLYIVINGNDGSIKGVEFHNLTTCMYVHIDGMLQKILVIVVYLELNCSLLEDLVPIDHDFSV